LLEASDPDIKITSAKGKSFVFTKDVAQILEDNPSILASSKIIEERVFLEHNDKNEIAFIKGVQDNYTEITNIDDALSVGNWLEKEYLNTAVVGRTIAIKLSLGVRSFGQPLSIMVPKGGTGFISPNNAFYKTNVQIVGLYSGTEEFESKFVYLNLEEAQNLLRFKENQITGLELKLSDVLKSDEIAKQLQDSLGKNFQVQTKEQLNSVFYKVINTENFISYLIFTLIVIIALFNVIGAIIMMIIDKKNNLKTLFNLGVSLKEIKQIFVFQGFLLTLFGMFLGLIIGIILVFLQKQFSLFMITESLAYPVEFKLSNLLIIKQIKQSSILNYNKKKS